MPQVTNPGIAVASSTQRPQLSQGQYDRDQEAPLVLKNKRVIQNPCRQSWYSWTTYLTVAENSSVLLRYARLAYCHTTAESLVLLQIAASLCLTSHIDIRLSHKSHYGIILGRIQRVQAHAYSISLDSFT
jgi:hypothetical protein